MTQPAFYLMSNPIQHYEWGSRDALTRLFGMPNPDAQPQAELWMGAHPNGCSDVQEAGQALRLSSLIARDPVAMLGQATVERFAGLPFLFKVLAAEKALSIQVHPSKAQAQEGYQRDNAAGLAANAPHRNYRDDNHKPELVFALTPYQAMNGFRANADILALFERVAIAPLADALATFRTAQTEAGLSHFFRTLLTLEGAQKQNALDALLTYAAAHQDEETFALICHLGHQYPGDVGLFAPLLLHVITLQPGQSMYLDACTPHAYIRGTGLEIMANSDNVLRAGLTPKHINVDELLACTRCVAKPDDQILLAPVLEGQVQHYPVPVPDFTFSVYPAGRYPLTTHSAEILFAIDAPATLSHQSGETLTLQPGQSAFVPAATGDFTIETQGMLARAGNR